MKNMFGKSAIFLAAMMAVPALHAQTPPQAFSYQAVVRDGNGDAIRNQAVSVRIRLHQDSAVAAVAYAETFTPTTNGFGNVNLAIGRGTVATGTFSGLDWSRPMYVETAVDAAGGASYTDLGTTQLLSVPYALYSGTSGSVASVNVSEIRDADNNTKVSTERNPNENIIRFDLNGTERMRLRRNALEFPNNGGSVYIGDSAGTSINGGTGNLFAGGLAGRSTTTGVSNVFLGSQAGLDNTTGAGNIYLGYLAGGNGTTGSNNTMLGTDVGHNNTTGYNNTFVGYQAGFYTTTGFGNVYLGYAAGRFGNDTNKLYINNANGDPSLIWGDFAADSVRINGGLWVARTVTGTAFVNSSDRRLKENIAPLPNALDGIGKLNGVYYNYKAKAPDGNSYPASRQIGVIAQDVENVYPELVVTQPGGYKAVDYPKLTAVLIEAVKEQQRIITGQSGDIAELKSKVRMLEAKTGTAAR